ncbi:CBS domain-containing protein [Desulforhopalus singaporensis]|uniref:NanoRNase/pAp phosphatase, hydrolyzes c-di-AMP and oligoRNAs n=1 Tax=Desulforhopalus singaporensis TaxID=91360 RepID=A0A1H0LDN6_9BACT|nr:CBS domain-containing protein [Desulforhopalus singaporensis]SDO66091.1 nanoRNase/pAp phosphatase, hydrolyzes c-di-AMP and oligoRNAs [Desulforhopalus singaporensis]
MIIATTHKNTDFDGLASVIAATLLYPDCIGVVPKMTNKNVEQFLSTHKTAFNLILPNEVAHDQVDKLVVVDTDHWPRLDRMEKLRNRTDLAIDLWDHHLPASGNIEPTWQCRERIGATITLLIREMKKRKMQLSPLNSTIMLIGLYEDTGHLSFPTTSAEDAAAAAFLLENGADLNVANFFLNPPYEENQKEVLFEMMKETEKHTVKGHLIGFNVVHLEKKVFNLAAVVNMYRKIVNVSALFVIFTTEDRYTIIGRSGVDAVDVGEVLAALGGGGHSGAGSATIRREQSSPELIKTKILAQLNTQSLERASISDIMSFPVVFVSPDATMHEVRDIMARKNIRGILVMEDEKIIGVIVLWDLKRIKKKNQWNSPVKAFMSREVITITTATTPTMAARIMIENDVGYLPVVDHEQVVGIVTRTDILTYYYDLLPD